MADATSRRLVERLMHEVVAAANASGSPIDRSFVDEMLARTDAMAPYAPSMKLDFDAGRPLELDAIYGAPLDVAAAAGAPMVAVAALADQLRFLDGRNRRR
jgi:2-dehydropantoate 2-reductase